MTTDFRYPSEDLDPNLVFETDAFGCVSFECFRTCSCECVQFEYSTDPNSLVDGEPLFRELFHQTHPKINKAAKRPISIHAFRSLLAKHYKNEVEERVKKPRCGDILYSCVLAPIEEVEREDEEDDVREEQKETEDVDLQQQTSEVEATAIVEEHSSRTDDADTVCVEVDQITSTSEIGSEETDNFVIDRQESRPTSSDDTIVVRIKCSSRDETSSASESSFVVAKPKCDWQQEGFNILSIIDSCSNFDCHIFDEYPFAYEKEDDEIVRDPPSTVWGCMGDDLFGRIFRSPNFLREWVQAE